MAEKARALGVIRLPAAAFKANTGTEVVAYIIFLQKPYPGEPATRLLFSKYPRGAFYCNFDSSAFR